jgi:hypothetical protein
MPTLDDIEQQIKARALAAADRYREEMEERKKIRFAVLCKENGLNPDDREYGSPTLTAWLFFNIGWDEAREFLGIT